MTFTSFTHPNGVKVPRRIRSVAIIGGGPSGAIALDSLVQENSFDQITVFERSSDLGGVWNVDEKFNKKIPIPPGSSPFQLDPALQLPEFKSDDEEVIQNRSDQYRFDESAGYKDLRTNVPQQLMCFSDELTWGIPEERKIDVDYCKGDDVKEYIKRYFGRHKNDPKVQIVLETSLENVCKDYSLDSKDPNSQFVLTLREQKSDSSTDRWYKQRFDALIIATGHYHVPFIPNVLGLDKVFESYPEKIIHSKYFIPKIDLYRDENVLVVGGKISGLDIVISLSKTARWVYHSIKDINEEFTQQNDGFENIIEKPLVTKYELGDNGKITVHFKDGSIVGNIDRIFYATGYHQSFPFMNKYYQNFTTGTILADLYDHTIYIKDPLISVIGLPVQAVTFRAFEYQAIWVARYLSGKLELPSVDIQNTWALDRFQRFGNKRIYHAFDKDKFDWTRRLIVKAGGVEPIDGRNGRRLPVYTPEDEALHATILRKYAEEVYFFLDPTKQYF